MFLSKASLRLFRVLCLVLPLLFLFGGGSFAKAQTIDDVYDDSILHEVRLTMAPSDWTTLQANYTKSTRYHVTFRWRDIVITDAAVRVRGSGSRNPIKPGLGLEFDRFVPGQQFLGTNQLYLKNLAEEPSMMNERLGMKLIRRLGLPAPRDAYARVYLNDEYLGLFLITESIDQQYVQRNLGESGGTIYSYNYGEPYHFEYLGENPALYTPEPFEPSPEKDPHPEFLVDMIRTINQAPDEEFLAAISKYFDPYLMMAHVAADNFLTEADGIVSTPGMANFYLYRRDNPMMFQFLHWDKDYTLFEEVDRSVLWNLDTNVLTRRAMQVPELRRAYLDMIADAALVAGGPDGWLVQETRRVYEQIHQAALEDTHKQCGGQNCSNEAFEAAAAGILDYASRRGPNVLTQVTALRAQQEQSQFTITPGSVTSAGQGQSALAPGSLATLATGDLPNAGGPVSVSINGRPAPVVDSKDGKLIFQVPWEATPGAAYLQVQAGNQTSQVLLVPLRATAPGIVSVRHADGSEVLASNPAAPGEEIVVYATGLGAVSPAPATGQQASTIGNLIYPPKVFLNGIAVETVFSGLLPTYVGLYQLNVQVPDMWPDSLTLEVNSQLSDVVSLTP